MSEELHHETSPKKPRLWVRLLTMVAVLATGWHILASFLWIAPYSANAREIVPGNALTSYMIPMFGQSWSVFAPEPINGDYHFNVRAKLTNGTETGWVSATDVELSMIQYNLAPPRAGIQSSEVASSYKNAFDNLRGPQQSVIGGNFEVENWQVGLQAALESQFEADSEAATTPNTAQIEALLGAERRATAYATQVAFAIWGDDVAAVQYRVSRQNIVPFAQRHDPNASRPEPSIVLPGWRGLLIEEGQSQENFAAVFGRQFERIAR